MQDGDLATSVRPHIVVVLEGVLATVTPVERRSRYMRRLEVVSFNFLWHDTPLKRIATMKRNWPDTAIDVVTFLGGDVADMAATFFQDCGIPVDSTESYRFDHYTSILRYQSDVTMIVDSDDDRLDRYGQLGRAVLMGQDFG
jgi:hypothetical protein